LKEAVQWVAANYASDPTAVHAGSVPYLRLWGIVAGGWQMARAARIASDKLAAGAADAAFYRAKIATARFFADYLLSQADGWKQRVLATAPGAMALADEAF
jgi:butyryl-CoA dehydrogenase